VCIDRGFISTPNSYDSSNDSESEEHRAKHKKAKKHKKHKKSSSGKGEKDRHAHKKHKKAKKRPHRASESSNDSDAMENAKAKLAKNSGLSSKFTEIMQKASRNGADFRIAKPMLPTDPSSLVEEITKTIQNKVLPVLEVASSGSESDV